MVLEALTASGWKRTIAAHALGVTPRALGGRIARMRARGHDIPNSPYDGVPFSDTTYYAPPPKGFNVKGVSTLHGPDGEVKAQWVKTAVGEKSPEQWTEHVRDALAAVEPLPKVPSPPAGRKDLLTVYPIGDHHVAMYAWGEETGADYDLKIAEQLLVGAVTHLVECAPTSDTAMIVNVGDFFHVDNLRNETSRSHNALDVDTRYQAMIRAGVRMLRAVVELALTKHRRVRIVNACGNHDDIGAMWLSLALSLFYENNPRVEVELKPGKFHYYRHGKVLIGVTHGDSVKLERLQGVMSADRSQDWGETRHRYWLTGHIHQRKVLEDAGVMIESFRTLAARDAWASAAGYRSGRDMTAIVFHAEHGEVARHRVDVGMLECGR